MWFFYLVKTQQPCNKAETMSPFWRNTFYFYLPHHTKGLWLSGKQMGVGPVKTTSFLFCLVHDREWRLNICEPLSVWWSCSLRPRGSKVPSFASTVWKLHFCCPSRNQPLLTEPLSVSCNLEAGTMKRDVLVASKTMTRLFCLIWNWHSLSSFCCYLMHLSCCLRWNLWLKQVLHLCRTSS